MFRKRILVCSPVCKEPEVLVHFLRGLLHLDRCGCLVHFHFIDDNRDPESSSLLKKFARDFRGVYIEEVDKISIAYRMNDFTHTWTTGLIYRVAAFKNLQIEFALKHGYDYVLFVDSDVVLHPDTLKWLLAAEKDIVSEVYWTKWKPGFAYMPQVWKYDNYAFYLPKEGEGEKEYREKSLEFFEKIRHPGLYRVGGLGALTLISRRALKAGVSFSPLYNLSWTGEDRHFCIRATALGFVLYADTHASPFHIYRPEDLQYVPGYFEYIEHHRDALFFPPNRVVYPERNTITLMMPVRNEAGKCLERVLDAVRPFIDKAVVVDDGSTDSTKEIVWNALQDKGLKLIAASKFENEKKLREFLWERTVESRSDFILALDADEVLDVHPGEIEKIKSVLGSDTWCFRLFDMWDEEHYREDEYWQAHKTYRPFIFRYQPLVEYSFASKPVHFGRFPEQVLQFPIALGKSKVLHYGWSKKEWREEKYRKYMEIDPNGEWGILEQYRTILDESPTLKPIKEVE